MGGSSRPADATMTVTRAAQVLGVHPNTVRAWSDAGRLRYYRINPRGDRRYRMTDLQRFLSASVATEPPHDGLDLQRARRHRAARGEGHRRRRAMPEQDALRLQDLLRAPPARGVI